MARHSLSEAAKLAGISRTALYTQYIDKGKLSVQKDERNKPYVETAELHRVFGELSRFTTEAVQENTELNSQNTVELAVQTERLKSLEELVRRQDQELQLYREREQRLTALLELKTQLEQPPKKRGWWPWRK